MTNNHSIYHEHAGQYVIVNTRIGTFVGLLETDSHESLHLRPSIVSEPTLLQFGDRKDEMKNVPHYRLERERPSIFATLDVSAVQPTTEKHVMGIVNYDRETYEMRFRREGESGGKKE